ncbi:MAG TPA: hypothetical protein PK185_15960 [Cyclobacteriaceae bacterium]|nr:hypothetical protein [Cyclobacteriaceae bacterium]
MRKRIIHIALVICCTTVYAQTVDDYVEEIGWGEFSTQFNYERPAPEIKGEYYLFHDWVEADIYLYDGVKYKGKQLNMNLLSGDIEVPSGYGTRVLDKFKIKSIAVGDRKFVNTLHLEGVTDRNAFFEVIEDGAIHVYCQYYSIMRQPSYGVPGAGNDRDFTAIIRQTYFVQGDSTTEMFTDSRKSNLKYFQDDSEAVEFIAEEKLRVNKIKDFTRAVRYYNAKQPCQLNQHPWAEVFV